MGGYGNETSLQYWSVILSIDPSICNHFCFSQWTYGHCTVELFDAHVSMHITYILLTNPPHGQWPVAAGEFLMGQKFWEWPKKIWILRKPC